MDKSRRFEVLDSFRGIFAVSVMGFHMHVVGGFTQLQYFRQADLFVEFFFVLSGFVLAHGYGSRPNLDFKKFLISRAFRLFPLHVAMLAVFIGIEFVKLAAHSHGVQFNNEPFTDAYAPSEIIPNLLLLQSWTHMTHHLSFNHPSWSISVEFYTYVLFGLVILFAFRARYVVAAVIAVAALVLMNFGAPVLTDPALRGLSCFFAGTLCYFAFTQLHHRVRLGYWIATTLEVLVLVGVVVILTRRPAALSWFVSVLFSAVIFLFAFESGAVSRLLTRGLPRLLGKLSYSIYMTHAAVLFCITGAFIIAAKFTGRGLAPMIDGQRYITTGNPVLDNLVAIAIGVTVVAISTLTYRFIERPGQEWGRRVINAIPASHRVTSPSG